MTHSTRTDRTTTVVDLRPPAWDWVFETDGALALEEGVDSWWNLPVPPDPLHRSAARTGASRRIESALSSPRPPPQPHAHPRPLKRRRNSVRTARRRRPRPSQVRRVPSRARKPSRHTGRIVALAVASFALVVMLFLTAFGSSGTDGSPVSFAQAKRLNPAPPPRPQVLAVRGPLRLQLPISESRVTAIGYHSAASALALDPVGTRANEGIAKRIVRRLFGGGGRGIRYYQLGGHGGPSTGVLNVGAPSGTDVYSPVDGTVVGLGRNVVSGRKYGVRIDIQPTDAPSLVVSVTHLRADPALDIGDVVAASRSKIGSVIDFSKVQQQALARYTQDAGNHVAIEVQPAATLAIP
jgi:murein DD-endopeptidase MepM/ murein hydrolase activator NlpD